ncbi:MAG: hypothetical protein V8T24_03415 [Roseburia hominis]
MNYKLYWELTNEGDARLLRAFGETPEPRFPAEIEGRAITEIGDYCFAAQAHLPAECRCSYVQAEPEQTAHRRQRRTGRCRRSREQTAHRRQRRTGRCRRSRRRTAQPETDGALAELAGRI